MSDGVLNENVVYLMRALPCCGKSFTARQLAGESGVVCETDEYFYTHVGDDPRQYDYKTELLPLAQQWNFERFQQAIQDGKAPIVVDRGNSLNLESQRYAKSAVEHGYQVELKEPDSPWWQEIRVLLKYKRVTRTILHGWAKQLAKKSKSSHRVPESTIRHWMDNWKWDVTIEDILAYETPSDGEEN